MLLLISSEMEKGQRKAIKITGQYQTQNRFALHGQSVAKSKPSNNTKNNNTGIAANLAMPPAKLISICDYTLHPLLSAPGHFTRSRNIGDNIGLHPLINCPY